MMEWTPDRVSTFWDYWSQFPEAYFTYQVGDRVAEYFADVLAGKDRVLDYGCGTGFLIGHLLAAGHRVAGADTSPDSIRATSELYEGRERFLGAYSIDEVLACDERWPAATCCEVVEHLDDVTLATAVDGMHTILEPDGLALVTTPNEEDLEANYLICPATGELFHRWQHMRSWSVDTLTSYFGDHGFEPVRVEACTSGTRRPAPCRDRCFGP